MPKGSLISAMPVLLTVIADTIDGNFKGKMGTVTNPSTNITASTIGLGDLGSNHLEVILEQTPIPSTNPPEYNLTVKQLTIYNARGIVYQYP